MHDLKSNSAAFWDTGVTGVSIDLDYRRGEGEGETER